MIRNNDGFSLVELLIALAIIAALVAVSLPLFLNTIKSARATAVSENLKLISDSIYDNFYSDKELPTDMNNLVRNVDDEKYGVAYKENDDETYEYIIFTSDNADILKIHELLPNVSTTIPEDEEEYEFLSNGRSTFENLTAKYSLAFTENGLEPDFDESGWSKKAIFNGDQTAQNYVVNATVDIINPGTGNVRGYAIYIRASGEASNINAYAFQIDPGINRFIVRIVENGGEKGVAAYRTFSSLGINFNNISKQNIQIQVNENHFIMTFNGVEVLNFTDNTYSKGWVGVRQWGSIRLVFSSFSIN